MSDKARLRLNCMDCKRFHFSAGEEDWSDETPGERPDMCCLKAHWAMDFYGDDETSYRKKLSEADTCTDYEERD